ncbi:MAG TPA: class A beta-lactamase, partial [Caulobacteraceae bacterium]|nr:class A beta-lactamase [Caulobacteraceae bacterium]
VFVFLTALACFTSPAAPTHSEGTVSLSRPALPPAPADVQTRLARLAGAFRGDAGVAIMDVEDGWMAAYNAQRDYPQQSVAKVWVALAVMDAVDRGVLSLEDPIVVRRQDLSLFYQPISRQVGANGYATTIGDLLHRAIEESDNAADDILMERVGGAAAVEKLLSRKHLGGIRVGDDQKHLQSRIAGLTWRPEYIGWAFKAARETVPMEVRDASLAAYLADPPDRATPAAVAQALTALARGQLLTPQSTAALLTVMGGTVTGQTRLRAGLERDWSIAHKTGTGPDWRGASVGINDVALVRAPDGHRYAVAVFIGQTVATIPERRSFMQAVARTVVEHWNEARQSPQTPSATAQTRS